MKSNQHTDAELVEAYKAGDINALNMLVKRWHKLFCDKAYWLVKEKHVAKDIAQDSWSIIMCKIDNLKDPKQFKYWAYRIVCNKSTDWLRLQAKKQKNTVSYTVEIESNDSLYSEDDRKYQFLLKAINDLSENQKIVVKLFYSNSYSLKQISEILNISIGTVKSRLFHSREKLKTILKHNYYEN